MNDEELKALALDLGKKNADSMKAMFEAAKLDDQKAATELQAKLLNELGADSPHIKAMQSQLDVISTDIKTRQTHDQVTKSFRDVIRDADVVAKTKELFNSKIGFTVEVPLNLNLKIAVANMTNALNFSGGLPKPTWIPGLSKAPDEIPFLSQLIPTIATTSNTVYYINRTARNIGAAAVTPGNALPQVDYTWAGASAAVVDYGAYAKIHQNALDDNDFVAGQLDAEIPMDVLTAFDTAILTAILSGATAFAVGTKPYAAAVVDANYFDVLRAAINQARGNNYWPDLVLVNTDDYAMMEMTKTSQGIYVVPQFISANGLMVSGVKIVPNNLITSGTYAVCTLGRTYLAMRQNLVMEWGLDSTDFTLRMVTVRAYLRGVYIKSTTANLGFITGTFATDRAAMNL
ncbi:phage major capsid protein [bacterium]|nr:MAG: phage major capsid protein [bacterium]